jgi:glycosyltransferase involved in cell wall biosynthesis
MTGKPPRFSVVIPTYNRAELLIKTLKSVLEQTYTDFEVIVVDNCSIDNTSDVIQPYLASGKVQYIRHDKNYERAVSRNTGMENARGEFLTFLDSDDIAKPNNLELADAFIRANPKYKIFHNLYELVDDSGNLVYRNKFPSLKRVYWHIIQGNFLSCIGVFISREIYQTYKFDTNPEIIGSEDWDFWLRVLADNELGRIDSVTSLILQHENRTVRSIPVEDVVRRKKIIIDKVAKNKHLNRVYGKYLPRMKASAYLYAGVMANSFNDYKSALRMLNRSLKRDWTILFNIHYWRALQIAFSRLLKSNLKSSG